MPKVAVLVSFARHAASGRSMRSPLSARAVELALRLPNTDVVGLYLGDRDPALGDFMGMGLSPIHSIEGVSYDARVPAALDWIARQSPDLVMAGGPDQGSGMLPYLLASALGWPLVAGAAELARDPDGWRVVRALPRGLRQTARTRGSAIICAGTAAPVARLPAHGKAARGTNVVEAWTGGELSPPATVEPVVLRPERRRGRPIVRPNSGGGRSPLDAFMPGSAVAGSARLLSDLTAQAAADTILGWLDERGLRERRSERLKS